MEGARRENAWPCRQADAGELWLVALPTNEQKDASPEGNLRQTRFSFFTSKQLRHLSAVIA
jgi:hypothetical protein